MKGILLVQHPAMQDSDFDHVTTAIKKIAKDAAGEPVDVQTISIQNSSLSKYNLDDYIIFYVSTVTERKLTWSFPKFSEDMPKELQGRGNVYLLAFNEVIETPINDINASFEHIGIITKSNLIINLNDKGKWIDSSENNTIYFLLKQTLSSAKNSENIASVQNAITLPTVNSHPCKTTATALATVATSALFAYYGAPIAAATILTVGLAFCFKEYCNKTDAHHYKVL